jgi:hypothetical protein
LRCGIELRLGPSQIKVFSLYFINFWETINVFQLISQSYSKIQIFQKKFILGSIGSSWQWLQFKIQLFPLRKKEQGVVDGGCDLRNKYTTTFGSPTAQKICSNFSIRRRSFLFIDILSFFSYRIKILILCTFLITFSQIRFLQNSLAWTEKKSNWILIYATRHTIRINLKHKFNVATHKKWRYLFLYHIYMILTH